MLLIGLGKQKSFGEKEQQRPLRTAKVKALGESGATDATLFFSGTAVGERSLAWKIRQGGKLHSGNGLPF